MKIISSRDRECVKLEEQLDRARERLRQRDEEISRLKTRLSKYEAFHPSKTGPVKESDQSIPRYMRPTAASVGRSVRVSDKERSPTTPYRFRLAGKRFAFIDGKLKTLDDSVSLWDVPHHQAPTCASRGKFTRKLADKVKRKELEGAWDREGVWASMSSCGDSETTLHESDVSNECWDTASDPRDDDVKGWSDVIPVKTPTAETSLAERSRLDDEDWLQGPVGLVYIPSKVRHRLLVRAHRLAQATFYDAARRHWPNILRWRFRYGPHEVLFGRDELIRSNGEYPYHQHFRQVGEEWSSQIGKALFDLVQLRNTLSHFGTMHHLYQIDDLMKRTQKLAVVLGDEKRAFKARQLREELQHAAEKSLSEVAARAPLAELPGLPLEKWKQHHRDLFRRLSRPEEYPFSKEQVSPTVLRLADVYGLLHKDFSANSSELNSVRDGHERRPCCLNALCTQVAW
jgi:hypothetical protein